MQEISFKTAEIYSQFPARQKISWELGSQVPEENPALVVTAQQQSQPQQQNNHNCSWVETK